MIRHSRHNRSVDLSNISFAAHFENKRSAGFECSVDVGKDVASRRRLAEDPVQGRVAEDFVP